MKCRFASAWCRHDCSAYLKTRPAGAVHSRAKLIGHQLKALATNLA